MPVYLKQVAAVQDGPSTQEVMFLLVTVKPMRNILKTNQNIQPLLFLSEK